MATPVNNIINTISISIDNLFKSDELDEDIKSSPITHFDLTKINETIDTINCPSATPECTVLASNVVEKVKQFTRHIVNKETKDKINNEDYEYKYFDNLKDIIPSINSFITHIMVLENYIGFDNERVNEIFSKYINIIKNIVKNNIYVIKKNIYKPLPPQQIIVQSPPTRNKLPSMITGALKGGNKYKMKYDNFNNNNIFETIRGLGIIKLEVNTDNYKIKISPEKDTQEFINNILSIPEYLDIINDPNKKEENENNYKIINTIVNNINNLLDIASKAEIDFSKVNKLDDIIKLLVDKFNILLYDIDIIFNTSENDGNKTVININNNKLNKIITSFKETIKDDNNIKEMIENSTNKFDENTYYKLFTPINSDKEQFFIKEKDIDSNINNKITDIIKKYIDIIINNICVIINNIGLFNLFQIYSRGTRTFNDYLKHIYIECNNTYKTCVPPNLEHMVTNVLNEFVVLDTADTNEIANLMTGTLEEISKMTDIGKVIKEELVPIPENKYIINDEIYKQKYLKYKQKYLQLKNN